MGRLELFFSTSETAGPGWAFFGLGCKEGLGERSSSLSFQQKSATLFFLCYWNTFLGRVSLLLTLKFLHQLFKLLSQFLPINIIYMAGCCMMLIHHHDGSMLLEIKDLCRTSSLNEGRIWGAMRFTSYRSKL